MGADVKGDIALTDEEFEKLVVKVVNPILCDGIQNEEWFGKFVEVKEPKSEPSETEITEILEGKT